ncbi:hypothetical protein COU15_01865 [Candidatus Kaiserbacteria bacterium CG10_big_fil_rev_8_21_14_0_10_45_20]|uniref:Type II secretion system protein GspF domain-containing protein n=1 Tax=Candidatus Kaiserbacteria bacterium CG10_big_fil_rev_8_21_14_0_10_45_20 TaxID=1974607 RepID=A0A2H0UFD7_9BACT|nr:MAG: hypothetical protein COU15_01865 [Candidatus Kaiserbacteria bacterium CG10_big_fil_rev_8_21_14_0_10_45_20]
MSMSKFKVKAITKGEDSYEEVIDAEDKFAAYREIRERGDTVISLKETQGKGGGGLSLSSIDIFLSNVSADEKVMLTRNLAAMLEAGLTASRALEVIEKQTKNKKLKSVLQSIVSDVKKGDPLSSAFARFDTIFSPLLISMVRAGEESGQMAESLRVVSSQMESSNNLSKRIKGAMMYPSIVLIAMVIIGILMLMYVVPTLTQTFSELGTELPITTQMIIGASNFLASNTVIALLGIFLVVVGFIYALRTKVGARVSNFILLRVPVIGDLIKEVNSARTTRTISSLLSAGVDMVLAISITKDVVQNSFYQKVLIEAEASVVKGGSLSETFRKYPKLYPPLVPEMAAVGEETGRLSEMLNETAQFYESSVERQTKDLSTIIEPILMLFIGSVVGFFALSMIAPIYSLSSAI